MGKLTFSKSTPHGAMFEMDILVTVRNTGTVRGSEVVQLYLTLPANGLTTPKLQLRGFGKAKDLAPGESAVVKISLDRYAVSYWDAVHNVWSAKAGTYEISVGRSSADIVLRGDFTLNESFTWSGI